MENSKSKKLLITCFILYACTYFGKYSYNSNINSIMSYFEVNHASAGLVATFFFFTYGFGQFFHGAMSKRYNAKYAVSLVLIVSGIINLSLTFIKYFPIVKFLWGLNGICLGLIWPTISRFLLNNVEDGFKQKAMYVMCMSTPTGILLAYGTSALMVKLGMFKTSFYIASVLLPLVAVIWFLISDKFKVETTNEIQTEKQEKTKSQFDTKIFIYLGFFAFECVFLQLIREGMTSWTPTILKESLNVSDSLSLLLTILLPIIAIIGPVITSFINGKIKKMLPKTLLMNLVELPLLVLIILFLNNKSVVLTVTFLCVLYLALTVLESVFSSNIPILLKGKVDYGFISGFINGCCYIGSTISTYALGLIADKFGWNYIFYLFIGLVLLLLILILIMKLIKNEYFDKTIN